jgi:hypothetical protein
MKAGRAGLRETRRAEGVEEEVHEADVVLASVGKAAEVVERWRVTPAAPCRAAFPHLGRQK